MKANASNNEAVRVLVERRAELDKCVGTLDAQQQETDKRLTVARKDLEAIRAALVAIGADPDEEWYE